ncbi:hypothetical protein CL656_04010 [bacterium]|nr:hypothetical protein [bacterium]|tara:strand:+ start:574 stop:1983 length:1410 start_codon:yes stop_codon:yes gene_type:complete
MADTRISAHKLRFRDSNALTRVINDTYAVQGLLNQGEYLKREVSCALYRNLFINSADVGAGIILNEFRFSEDDFAENAASEVAEIAAERALGAGVFGFNIVRANLAPLLALAKPSLRIRLEDNDKGILATFKQDFVKDFELSRNAPITAILTKTALSFTGIFLDVAKLISFKTIGKEKVYNYVLKKLMPKDLQSLSFLRPEKEFSDKDFDEKISQIYSEVSHLETFDANFYAYELFFNDSQCVEKTSLAIAVTIKRLIKLAKDESFYSGLTKNFFDQTLSNLYALLNSSKRIDLFDLQGELRSHLSEIHNKLNEIAEVNPNLLQREKIREMIKFYSEKDQSNLIGPHLQELTLEYFNTYKKFNSYQMPVRLCYDLDDLIESYESISQNCGFHLAKDFLVIHIVNQITFSSKIDEIKRFARLLNIVLKTKNLDELERYIPMIKNLFSKYEILNLYLSEEQVAEQEEKIFG